MAKGYWIAVYRSITNAGALAEYAKLAGPAIEPGEGSFWREVFRSKLMRRG
jgi:hypothetical protein